MKTETKTIGPATLPDMWQSTIRGRLNPGTERDEQGFRKLSPFESYLRDTFLNILQDRPCEILTWIEELSIKERQTLLQKTRLTRVIRSSVTRNPKTFYSFDPSPCPRKTQGNPCPYCYTLSSAFKMPAVILPYSITREIQRISQRMIDKLNSTGGIRIFSRGDYDGRPETDAQIDLFLNDCKERGLRTKAITKNLSFIDRHHDNPGLTTVNISLDRFETVPFATATAYREKYNKVTLRMVILNDEDLTIAQALQPILLTFGHGNNFYTRQGFKAYTKEEKIRLAGNMPTCCVTGKTKPHHFFDQNIEIQTCENCIYGCQTERKGE